MSFLPSQLSKSLAVFLTVVTSQLKTPIGRAGMWRLFVFYTGVNYFKTELLKTATYLFKIKPHFNTYCEITLQSIYPDQCQAILQASSLSL